MPSKVDCFFYTEDMDMGARIPVCMRIGLYEKFCCDKCRYFITKRAAKEIVLQHIIRRHKNDELRG